MGETRRRFSGILLLACFLLVACGGPEAKKAKFLERGKEYSREGGFRQGGAGIQERDPDRPEIRRGVPPAGVVPALPGRYPRRVRQPVEGDGSRPEAAAGAGPAREIAADRGRAGEGDGEGRARPRKRPGRRGRPAPERGGPGGREGDREGARRTSRGSRRRGSTAPTSTSSSRGCTRRRRIPGAPRPPSCGGSRRTGRTSSSIGRWPTCTPRGAGTTRRRRR